MARSAKVHPITPDPNIPPSVKEEPPPPPKSNKALARIVQLGIGVDLLGSRTSIQATRGNELEITPLGVVATSGKNQRRVLIPWANIRGVELDKV